MTTDLGVLTTAAEKWQSMAADLSKVEERYGETVQKITLGQNWRGFRVEAAQTKFATTRREYKSAQTEAKAVAKLLRDAHTGFADLKKKVESARDDAVAAGMAVSASGRATFDFTRVQDPAQARTLRRDPELKSVEESWTAHITAAVRAVDEFDKAVKQALEAVVVDGNILDGTIGEFNASASPVTPPTGSARSEQKFTDAEKWIFEEMERNVKSDTVGQIRSLLDEPEWYEFVRNYGSDVSAALTMWGVKVAPGQDWDHKPQFQERYDLQTIDSAAGFDADTLIKGASLGETLLTGDDDQGDQITMRVGIELYNNYGDNLTEEQLRQGISAAMDQMEQAQRNGENVPQVRSRK
ncbi:hypothetical protein [Streptomyces racemochromogenes]|uniref:hypothetical protein n=1 Tax=Streptomyces racemochromogenes TaxID=67353 RepID=UPI0035EF4038